LPLLMPRGNNMKRLHSFTQALFSLAKEKPLAKISIEELCDRVGVKRQTFYYHFKDMGDFIDSIMVDFCEKRVDKDGDLNSDARFVADLFSSNVKVLKNFISSPYAININNFIHDYLHTRSYSRLSANVKYKNLPSEQIESVSRIVASIILSELSYWINTDMNEEKEYILHRFEVILKNVEKMMVENALRGTIENKRRVETDNHKEDKH